MRDYMNAVCQVLSSTLQMDITFANEEVFGQGDIEVPIFEGVTTTLNLDVSDWTMNEEGTHILVSVASEGDIGFLFKATRVGQVYVYALYLVNLAEFAYPWIYGNWSQSEFFAALGPCLVRSWAFNKKSLKWKSTEDAVREYLDIKRGGSRGGTTGLVARKHRTHF